MGLRGLAWFFDARILRVEYHQVPQGLCGDGKPARVAFPIGRFFIFTGLPLFDLTDLEGSRLHDAHDQR